MIWHNYQVLTPLLQNVPTLVKWSHTLCSLAAISPTAATPTPSNEHEQLHVQLICDLQKRLYIYLWRQGCERRRDVDKNCVDETF